MCDIDWYRGLAACWMFAHRCLSKALDIKQTSATLIKVSIMCTYMCVCVCVCACVCVCVCARARTCVYTYLCVCMCLCTCICVSNVFAFMQCTQCMSAYMPLSVFRFQICACVCARVCIIVSVHMCEHV